MITFFIILAALTSVSGFYFYRWLRKPKITLSSTEGIYFKYKTLIETLLAHDKRAYLSEAKSNSIRIQVVSAKESASYFVTEVGEKVIVVWTWTGSEFGPRGKEWSFSTTLDQEQMSKTIFTDLNVYQASIYQGHNKRSSEKCSSPS